MAKVLTQESNQNTSFGEETVSMSGYGINSLEDAFADFEPHHCGEPAFTDNILKINGKTIGPFQQYSNSYTEKISNIEPVEASKEIYLTKKDGTKESTKVGYKINGKFIKGCKKGTVVLANSPDEDRVAKIDSGSTLPVSIEVDKNNEQKILYVNEKQFQEKTHFKNSGFPIKLGVLLAAGGGGAGGGTWYDAEKNGRDTDQYYYSGGSGGGGGTIWGCINLTGLEITTDIFDKTNFFKNLLNNYQLIKKDLLGTIVWDVGRMSLFAPETFNEWLNSITDPKQKNCFVISRDYTYVTYRSKMWENLLYNLNSKAEKMTVKLSNLEALKKINKDLYNKLIRREAIRVGITDTYLNISKIFDLTESEFEDLIKALEKNYPDSPINGYSGVSGGTYPINYSLTHDTPQPGTEGIAGATLTLYSAIKVTFKVSGEDCTWYLAKNSSKIAVAYGGSGGTAGHWENVAGGGSGGKTEHNKAYFNLCGYTNGEDGISVDKNTKDAVIAAKSFYIDFLPDTTEQHELSEQITLPRLSGTVSTTASARIPGGHGIGSGADKNTLAGYGGGGCSNENSNGGDGYYAIYY